MTIQTVSMRRSVSRLHLAVYVGVAGVLAAVFAERAERIGGDLERASFQFALSALRESLVAYGLQQRVTGRPAPPGTAGGTQNPLAAILDMPPGFAGVLPQDSPEMVAPGSWYYARREGLLVYRVSHAERLQTELAGPGRVRFRLCGTESNNPCGRDVATGKDAAAGPLRLLPAEAYSWH